MAHWSGAGLSTDNKNAPMAKTAIESKTVRPLLILVATEQDLRGLAEPNAKPRSPSLLSTFDVYTPAMTRSSVSSTRAVPADPQPLASATGSRQARHLIGHLLRAFAPLEASSKFCAATSLCPLIPIRCAGKHNLDHCRGSVWDSC